MFDFGISRVRYIPDHGVLQRWSWSILFRNMPGRIFHIVRRTGNLKEWK